MSLNDKLNLIDSVKKRLHYYLTDRYGLIDDRNIIFTFTKTDKVEVEGEGVKEAEWTMISNVSKKGVEPLCQKCFYLLTTVCLGYYLSKLPKIHNVEEFSKNFWMIWKTENKDCVNLTITLPKSRVATFSFTEQIGMEQFHRFYLTAYELCKKIAENGIILNKN
jgi:hypothetical protein